MIVHDIHKLFFILYSYTCKRVLSGVAPACLCPNVHHHEDTICLERRGNGTKTCWVPSVIQFSYGKWHILNIYSWFPLEKIVIFHSYVKLTEGIQRELKDPQVHRFQHPIWSRHFRAHCNSQARRLDMIHIPNQPGMVQKTCICPKTSSVSAGTVNIPWAIVTTSIRETIFPCARYYIYIYIHSNPHYSIQASWGIIQNIACWSLTNVLRPMDFYLFAYPFF